MVAFYLSHPFCIYKLEIFCKEKLSLSPIDFMILFIFQQSCSVFLIVYDPNALTTLQSYCGNYVIYIYTHCKHSLAGPPSPSTTQYPHEQDVLVIQLAPNQP